MAARFLSRQGKERRYVRCILPMNTIAHAITNKQWFKFFSDIPEDAEMISWFPDQMHEGISVVFYHPAFKKLDDGQEIPLGPQLQTAIYPKP